MLRQCAARAAQREAAKRAHEVELAESAQQSSPRRLSGKPRKERARAEAERVAREAVILAQQKAARDERYAARKAAKKQRRKG